MIGDLPDEANGAGDAGSTAGGDGSGGEGAGAVIGYTKPHGEPIVAGEAEVAVGLVVVVPLCPYCGQVHRYALARVLRRADPLTWARPWRWLFQCPSTPGRKRFVLQVDGRTAMVPAAGRAEEIASREHALRTWRLSMDGFA